MKKVILCGYYGQGNAGDEALLISILSHLPTTVKPIVLSANPQKTEKVYQVKSYSRWEIIKEILNSGKNDLFIWGGGSLIQDVTSIKSPVYYLTLMKLAQLKGLKTIAYAQGIGPINTGFIRWLTKLILKECHGISVRDKKSSSLLNTWKIKHLLAPDPVWALDAKINQNLSLLSSPRIVVNLRSHPDLTEDKINVITNSLIAFQRETKTNILILPFQASKDLAISQYLQEKLGKNSQIISVENPQELKGLFSQVDMVIGMRLHCLIMAKSEGCKCFAISYDPKVSILMSEVAIEGYELDKLPDDVAKITENWLNIYKKQQNVSDNIINLAKDALQHQTLIGDLV